MGLVDRAASAHTSPEVESEAEEDGQEIQVEAVNEAAETSSTVWLGKKELAVVPRRSAEELLRRAPGVNVVQHGSEGKGYQFFVRGFDAEHGADFEVRVGPFVANEWSNIHAQGYIDLGYLLPELVTQLVVHKGAFTVDQGPYAIAGSAQFHLGVPTEHMRGQVGYTAGLSNRHRLVWIQASPERSPGSFVGLEALHDDGFGQQRRIDRAAINARWRLLHRGGRRLDAWLLGHAANFELPTPLRDGDLRAGRVDLLDSYSEQLEGASARVHLALDYRRRWRRATSLAQLRSGYRALRLVENMTGFLNDPVHGDARRQWHQSFSWAGSLAHRIHLRPTFELYGRLDVLGQGIAQTEHALGPRNEQLELRHDRQGRQWHYAGQLGVDWKIWRWLHVDAGARFDLFQLRTVQLARPRARWALSPRVRLRLALGRAALIYAAYGRGFRPPHLRAFSNATREDQAEQAEQVGQVVNSDHAEFGFRLFLGSWFEGSLSGFATWLAREVVYDHVTGTTVELQGTQRIGGELIARISAGEHWQFGGDLSFVDARFQGSDDPVPFAPRWTSSLRASWRPHPDAEIGLRMMHVAPRTLPFGAVSSRLWRADLVFAWQLSPWTLRFEVENLLSRPQRESEYNFASEWKTGTSDPRPTLHVTPGAPLNLRLTLVYRY